MVSLTGVASDDVRSQVHSGQPQRTRRTSVEPFLTLRTAGCILFKRVDQKAPPMNVPAKRIILDADNPLFRKVHPVVLHIFCRGVQAAESKRLMLGALVSIAVTPIGWVIVVFRKAIHIGILLVVWWFLRDAIAEFGSLDYVLLAVGMTAIFYKEIYGELLDMFLHVLVLTTGGGFLRWMCNGYLSGTGFRQKILTTEPMEALIGTMVAAIPDRYRNQYDEIMDLYQPALINTHGPIAVDRWT